MIRSPMVAALTAVLFNACSPSQAGAQGTLRFGLLFSYPETQGFGPVAKGQLVPLAVQAMTKPALLNDYEFLEASLTARAADGTAATIERTDVGRFKGTFPKTGAFTLTATAPEGADTLEVTVAEQTQLRLARAKQFVRTTVGAEACLAPLADGAPLPRLKKNQVLLTHVVPADAAGGALLAKLELTTAGELVATRDSAITGASANGFTLAPRAGAGTQTVTFTDTLTAQTLTVTIEVDADEAGCPAK